MSTRFLLLPVLLIIGALVAVAAEVERGERREWPKQYRIIHCNQDLYLPETHLALAKAAQKSGEDELAREHLRFAAKLGYDKKAAPIYRDKKPWSEKKLKQLARISKAVGLKSDYQYQSTQSKQWPAWEAIKTFEDTGDAGLLLKLYAKARKDPLQFLARALARKLADTEHADDEIRLHAGMVEIDGEWVDPLTYLQQAGKVQDRAERLRMHQLRAQQTRSLKKKYFADPLYGSRTMDGKDTTDYGIHPYAFQTGMTDFAPKLYLITLPLGYTDKKTWPLVVSLHGGGSGDYRDSLAAARDDHYRLISAPKKLRYDAITIHPAAHLHCLNSWSIKENMLQVIDCIIDINERAPIDNSRVYLTGSSMGGNGCARMSWAVPEAFVRYVPTAGAYWTRGIEIPDLTGIQYLILHGAKDTGARNKSLTAFEQVLKKHGASHETIIYPKHGHSLPTWAKNGVMARTKAYFSTANAYATDWHFIRKVVDATVTDEPAWGKGWKPPEGFKPMPR